VKQGPEFSHAVLDGSPAQQQPVPTAEAQEELPTNAKTQAQSHIITSYQLSRHSSDFGLVCYYMKLQLCLLFRMGVKLGFLP
jgi:hypothetical protein